MCRFLSLDRLLIVSSLGWLVTLIVEPDLHERELAFWTTTTIIAPSPTAAPCPLA
jgi:hypothetical protein